MARDLEMAEPNSCRLCFSIGNDQHMNIFSDIGRELKISDIIAEHFKCDVNQKWDIFLSLAKSSHISFYFSFALHSSSADGCGNLDMRNGFIAEFCMPSMLVNNWSLSWAISKVQNHAREIPESNDKNWNRFERPVSGNKWSAIRWWAIVGCDWH